MTNFERIKQMSAKELQWFLGIYSSDFKGYCANCNDCTLYKHCGSPKLLYNKTLVVGLHGQCVKIVDYKKIKQMSVNTMARFINRVGEETGIGCGNYCAFDKNGISCFCNNDYTNCIYGIQIWLNQEVTENE